MSATKGVSSNGATAQRGSIPLVNNLQSDVDLGFMKPPKTETVSLDKMLSLLTDPLTKDMKLRHISTLKLIIAEHQEGFLMKSLVKVFGTINALADGVERHREYLDYLIELTRLCGKSFILEKTSDIAEYEDIVRESVSNLGYLMRVASPELRQTICDAILRLYTLEEDDERNLEEYHQRRNSVERNRGIIDQSELAATLVQSISLLVDDLATRAKVLEVLQTISVQAINCDKMLLANGAERLALGLNEKDPSGQLLFRTVEILWNLIEHGDKRMVAEQMSSQEVIKQLQSAFLAQLPKSHSVSDRQMRNDILVISSFIGWLNSFAPFVETGFMKQLVTLTTFTEMETRSPLVRGFRLMPRLVEDFELKKLLINFMVTMAHNGVALPLMVEGQLMMALLTFVKQNKNTAPPNDWTSSQFEELQLHALSALSTLTPYMIDEFNQCKGPTRLLLFLEWCIGKEDYAGHGNSYYGTGGRGNKRAQMRFVLRLIRSAVSTNNSTTLLEFSDQGTIGLLTGILKSAVMSTDPNDLIDIEMQCDMLYIISGLCESDVHRKELFGEDGVDVLIAYLKSAPKKYFQGLGYDRLILACVDTIWSGVIGCYSTEDSFLQKEGLFLLLDLMEIIELDIKNRNDHGWDSDYDGSPRSMQNVIMSCLVDLSENSKSIVHLGTWKGHSYANLAEMLCHWWRKEERLIGAKRDEWGAITDITNPLAGDYPDYLNTPPQSGHMPSVAIMEVYENMRAKIYCLFAKIGFQNWPTLSLENHVTLVLIERYLDFKQGEVWIEFVNEITQEGWRPIEHDRDAIETIMRIIDEKTYSVVEAQQQLIDAKIQQEQLDEEDLHRKIKDTHKQKERTIQKWEGFVARTSDIKALKETKRRQLQSIDQSRQRGPIKPKTLFHAIDVKNTSTTVFLGHYVRAEGAPFELPPTIRPLRKESTRDSLFGPESPPARALRPAFTA